MMRQFGEIKKGTVFNVFAFLPVLIGLGCVAFMMYVFWWPPKPAYQVDKSERHVLLQEGGFIRVHRMYCVNERIPVTISRDLIRIGSAVGSELRITLPQTTQVYELGCHTLDRLLELPKRVPPGNYRLVSVATWQANPFRADVARLPDLYVSIGAPEN